MGGGKLRPAGAKNPPKRQLPPRNAPKPASKTPQGPVVTKDGLPINWPSEVKYLHAPSYSKFVTSSQLDKIREPPPLAPPAESSTSGAPLPQEPVTGENGIIPLNFPVGPSPAVQIHQITDPNHPAYGQCGLFAARDLLPGELILPYYGVVHPGNGPVLETKPKDQEAGLPEEGTSETPQEINDGLQSLSLQEDTDSKEERERERLQHENSDYDLWLSREADLAVDGEVMGNEARFINDYRGVPGKERENAELRLVWDERIVHPGPEGTSPGRGEWTMAVYVLPLGKKARLKIAEAQAQAAERLKKKQAQGGQGKKAPTVPTTTKMSSVGVVKKGEEILVSYGRGFWERRRGEGA